MAEREARVPFRCYECGRFIAYGKGTSATIPSPTAIDPPDPTWWCDDHSDKADFYHRLVWGDR